MLAESHLTQRLFGAMLQRIVMLPVPDASMAQPGRFLARHFCRPELLKGALNRPESFELHARKAYILGEKFRINSWVRTKTGIIPVENQRPIVLFEQDLNTRAEDIDEMDFSTAEISDYFAAVRSEFDNILELYFPNGN